MFSRSKYLRAAWNFYESAFDRQRRALWIAPHSRAYSDEKSLTSSKWRNRFSDEMKERGVAELCLTRIAASSHQKQLELMDAWMSIAFLLISIEMNLIWSTTAELIFAKMLVNLTLDALNMRTQKASLLHVLVFSLSNWLQTCFKAGNCYVRENEQN